MAHFIAVNQYTGRCVPEAQLRTPPHKSQTSLSLFNSDMKRFTQLPISLYRIQVKPKVNLRDFDVQMAKGNSAYDLKTVDGMVLPMEGNTFHTPNGMSLRPNTMTMLNVLENFRGSPRVYALHAGTTLPDGLVVIHEHSDHYSLQTTKPIPLPDLNDKITDLLDSCISVTKEQFLAEQEDEDNQNN
jgi:hypothetical protein